MPELQSNEENATEGDNSGMTQPNQNGATEGNMPSSSEQSTSPETPTSRLMISQIVTENFKSYAGKVTLGPFHKVLYKLPQVS